MSGFITMQREALDHPILKEPERFRAWFWLVAHACWKQTPYDIGGRMVVLERGQLCASVRQLADAWGMSKSAVDRFFTRLKTETMIETEAGHGKLVITICNYNKYQSSEVYERDSSGTPTGTAAGQQRDIKEQGNKGTIDSQAKACVSDRPEEELFDGGVEKPAPEPVGDAVKAWNLHAGQRGWPACQKLSEPRRKQLAARLRDDGIDGWAAALSRAASSPYLGGSPPPRWFTFDWLIKAGNFLKVIEGNYDRSNCNGNDRAGRDFSGRGVDGWGTVLRQVANREADHQGSDDGRGSAYLEGMGR